MNEVFPSNILKPAQLLSIRYFTFCFLVLSIFIFSSIVHAGTIHVPADHSTIQAAIDAASGGDIVLVADGTYTGEGNKNLDFKGKSITVQSENGPENTIIDCENNGRGFYFHNGEGNDSILSGFTIKNGYGTPGGGIIIGESSNPTIENCIIKSNNVTGGGSGGGISINDSSPIITNSIISDNGLSWPIEYDTKGGGIFIGSTMDAPQSAPIIDNCKIVGNSAVRGGGIYSYNSSPEISNTVINNNYASGRFELEGGGGVLFKATFGGNPKLTNCILANNTSYFGGAINLLDWTHLTITNCTIVFNKVETAGGAIYDGYGIGSSADITNSIFWGNTPDEIFGFTEPNISYSTISHGWPGEGNIDLYPIFVDPFNDNFRLSNFSPSLAGGTVDGAPDIDLDGNFRPNPVGSNPDMGAYENILAVPEIPTLENVLNIFGMELGNQWLYEGTLQGEPYSAKWEITDIDQNTFPVQTYIFSYKKNGIGAGEEWFENAGNHMKIWRTIGEYEGSPISISLSQGLTVAWDTMTVNDHVYSTANTDIGGLIFNVSMTVDVTSKEIVSLNFETVEAFKVQYLFHLWGNGIDTSETFYRWIVPYLGVVKEQRAGSMVELVAFSIGGGNFSEPGDQDADSLSDYEEFHNYYSHWLIADSDFDGLDDGIEIDYWGIAWNEDPDGDLLINFLDSDSDNDGLNDGVEVLLIGTNPALADSDGNGLSDGEEVQCGSDPLDPNSRCSRFLPFLILLLE